MSSSSNNSNDHNDKAFADMGGMKNAIQASKEVANLVVRIHKGIPVKIDSHLTRWCVLCHEGRCQWCWGRPRQHCPVDSSGQDNIVQLTLPAKAALNIVSFLDCKDRANFTFLSKECRQIRQAWEDPIKTGTNKHVILTFNHPKHLTVAGMNIILQRMLDRTEATRLTICGLGNITVEAKKYRRGVNYFDARWSSCQFGNTAHLTLKDVGALKEDTFSYTMWVFRNTYSVSIYGGTIKMRTILSRLVCKCRVFRCENSNLTLGTSGTAFVWDNLRELYLDGTTVDNLNVLRSRRLQGQLTRFSYKEANIDQVIGIQLQRSQY